MENQPDNSDREEEAMIPEEAMAPLVPGQTIPMPAGPPGDAESRMRPLPPQQAILLSTSQKLTLAGRAVEEIGVGTAREMEAGMLADEINRRSGVGFEAAIIVALSIGR
jgi:hypothetical protein